jgi:hypothetical protein
MLRPSAVNYRALANYTSNTIIPGKVKRNKCGKAPGFSGRFMENRQGFQ